MVKIGEKDIIKATGYFLYIYYSDLIYISKFKEWKDKGKGTTDESYTGNLYDFLKKYNVTRTFKQGATDEILKKVSDWIDQSDDIDNVDEFVKKLKTKEITEDNIISLASKVLFLNNPKSVFPMDRLAKAAIGYSGNKYSEYSKKIEDFFIYDHPNIENEKCFKDIIPYAKVFEEDFKNLTEIEIIRLNRFKDILLWTIGEKK